MKVPLVVREHLAIWKALAPGRSLQRPLSLWSFCLWWVRLVDKLEVVISLEINRPRQARREAQPAEIGDAKGGGHVNRLGDLVAFVSCQRASRVGGSPAALIRSTFPHTTTLSIDGCTNLGQPDELD